MFIVYGGPGDPPAGQGTLKVYESLRISVEGLRFTVYLPLGSCQSGFSLCKSKVLAAMWSQRALKVYKSLRDPVNSLFVYLFIVYVASGQPAVNFHWPETLKVYGHSLFVYLFICL